MLVDRRGKISVTSDIDRQVTAALIAGWVWWSLGKPLTPQL